MAEQQSREARRADLATMLEGRSDEEIAKGVEAQGVEGVLASCFAGMAEAFLPEKAAGQSAVVQYDITAAGKTHSFQLKVAGGKCEVVAGAAGPARTTLGLNVADFLRLITGKLNGPQAFMSGKLRLTGDMMFAQVMQGWFQQP